MADYDLTGIKLDIEIGDGKKAKKDLEKIIKQLEEMGVNVKVGLDGTDAKKTANKVKQEIVEACASAEINPKLNTQAFTDTYNRLKKIREEVDSLAKVDIFTNENNNIQKTILTYQDGMGKIVTETMGWKEKLDEATGVLTRTFATNGFKYSDNIAKEQSQSIKEQIEKEKTLISLNEKRYALNKQVSALMKDSSFRDTDEYKDMAEINSQIKAIKKSEGNIDKEQLTNLNKMISDLKIKLDIETRYLAQKDKEETIQSRINKELNNVSNLKGNKFVSSDDIEKLNELEKKLLKFKVNSTDATHEFNKLSNSVSDISLNAKALEKVSKENDRIAKSTENARLAQSKLLEDSRKLAENNIVYDKDGLELFINKVKELDITSDKVTMEIKELRDEFDKLSNSAKESSSKFNIVNDIQSQLKKLDSITIGNDKYDSKKYNSIKNSYNDLIKEINSGNITLAEAKAKYSSLIPELKDFENQSKKLSDTTNSLSDRIKRYFQFNVVSEGVQLLKRGIRECVDSVRELDVSLVELQKVSDLTGDSLDDITNRAFNLGESLARTGKDVIDAVTVAKRAGFNMEDSFNIGEEALKMTNVAENIKSVDEATSALVGVLRGYGMEVGNVSHLVDAFNEVSNTQAVNFDDLVEGATRVSGVMKQQGNSYEEMLGLLTGGQEVLRNIEKVSSGLQTITLRLSGMNEEGDKLDPEITSKLTDEFERLAGVKLTDTNGQIRDTYDILQDMAKVFPTLDKNTRMYLSELSAGKRQANVLLAILDNWENVEKATDSAKNSLGSADKEMEKYINSIEGKTNMLKSNLQKLSIDFISSNTVKGVLDFSNAILKLIDSCGGLQTALIGVGTAMTILNWSKVSGFFTNTVKATKQLILCLQGATVATEGLSFAMNFLKGGVIVAGVMAVGAGIKYIAESSDRAKEKIVNLTSDIQKLNESKVQSNDLANQYNDLLAYSKIRALSTEEEQKFVDVQNQLKEIMPQVSGYYDEQGNFIITETDLVSKLNEVHRELIKTKQEEKALQAESVLDDNISSYEKELKALENIKEKQDALSKFKGNKSSFSGMSEDEVYSVTSMIERYGDLDRAIENVNSNVSQSNDRLGESLTGIRQNILDIISTTESWENLSKEQKNSIGKFISSSDMDNISVFGKKLSEDKGYANELVNELVKIPTVANDISNSINEVTGNSTNLKNVIDKTAIESIKNLNQVINSLNEGQTLTSDTILSLIDKYPQLRDKVTEVNGVYTISKEALEEVLQVELDESETAISAQIAKTKQVQQDTLNRLQMYKNEIGAIRDLASAQASLAGLNAKKAGIYANRQHGGFGGNKWDENSLNVVELSDKEKEAEQFLKVYEKTFADLDALDKKMQDFKIGTATRNTKKNGGFSPKSSGGGSKSKSADDKVKSDLDNVIKAIQIKRDKLDNEIAELEESLKFNDIVGNLSEVEKINSILDKKYSNRVNLTKQENASYELLKKKYKDTESIGKLEDLIASNNKAYQSDKIKDLEHEVSLIEKKSELAKEALETKKQERELKSILVDTKSDEYANMQKQAYDDAVKAQKIALDKIESLKAKGYKKDSELIKKATEEYRQAKTDEYNLTKWFADRTREETIKNLNEKAKGISDLQEYTLKMLKQEEQAKIDAIKKEEDGYARIIEARKKALQDERKTDDYNEKVSEADKEIQKITSKLNALKNDDSDKAKYERNQLNEQLINATKDRDKIIKDNTLQNQLDALDEELNNYKDTKDKEIQEVEKVLNNEVALRDKANKLIESRNKTLYSKLIQHSKEYGDISQEDITNAWEVAGNALDTYADKTKSLIELQKILANEIKNAENPNNTSFITNTQDKLNSGISNSNNTMTEREAKKQIQKNQQAYLHNKALDNKGNKGMMAWVEAERSRWGMDKYGAIIKEGIVPDDVWQQKKKMYGFSRGGEQSFTGEAIIHGTPTKPERVLSWQQTKDFNSMIKMLPDVINFSKNLLGINKNNNTQKPNLVLQIDKVISVDKMDDNTNISYLTEQVLKEINGTIRNLGY